ncbi:MAG: BrnA antitoxin family protein [Anaerolineales bacterium]
MKKEPTLNKSQTDFTRLDQMEEKDIDLSDAPEITPAMFAKAVVRRGLKPRTKSQLTLRLDSDVLAWFKHQGSGYQTKNNLLLRAYMEEHQKQAG